MAFASLPAAIVGLRKWKKEIVKNQPYQYTYPQLAMQKAATGPGSIFNQPGGSEFNQRQQLAELGASEPASVRLDKENEVRLLKTKANIAARRANLPRPFPDVTL